MILLIIPVEVVSYNIRYRKEFLTESLKLLKVSIHKIMVVCPGSSGNHNTGFIKLEPLKKKLIKFSQINQ